MNEIPESDASRGIHPPPPGEGVAMVAEEEGAALAEEEEGPLIRRTGTRRVASLTSLESLVAE